MSVRVIWCSCDVHVIMWWSYDEHVMQQFTLPLYSWIRSYAPSHIHTPSHLHHTHIHIDEGAMERGYNPSENKMLVAGDGWVEACGADCPAQVVSHGNRDTPHERVRNGCPYPWYPCQDMWLLPLPVRAWPQSHVACSVSFPYSMHVIMFSNCPCSHIHSTHSTVTVTMLSSDLSLGQNGCSLSPTPCHTWCSSCWPLTPAWWKRWSPSWTLLWR